MSRPRFRTRRIVNDKAKIQEVNDKAKIEDKEEYQYQSQDSRQGGLSMTRLRFRIRRSTNVKAKIQDMEDC